MERKILFIDGSKITKNVMDIGRDKVFVPKAGGSGIDPHAIGKPEYCPKNSVCSQTFLYAAFDSHTEAENFSTYLKTEFFRILFRPVKYHRVPQAKLLEALDGCGAIREVRLDLG